MNSNQLTLQQHIAFMFHFSWVQKYTHTGYPQFLSGFLKKSKLRKRPFWCYPARKDENKMKGRKWIVCAADRCVCVRGKENNRLKGCEGIWVQSFPLWCQIHFFEQLWSKWWNLIHPRVWTVVSVESSVASGYVTLFRIRPWSPFILGSHLRVHH